MSDMSMNSYVSTLKLQESFSFKTFIYLLGVVLQAFFKPEVPFLSVDLKPWIGNQPNNITENIIDYIKYLRKTEYKY